ncbi:hypothetical protein AGMMS50293_14260 [Spirochaetia bacterium]|nr:hypothetical protein AGMMS50293_14260 [Spirochaetia bacterium]
MNRRYAIFFVLLGIVVLNSCIGVSADITVRADGSGKIALEYRVSRMAEALGRLDGNERWQTIPAGRADFERSLARLPGMRLVSFSTKNETNSGGDIINNAELEFKNIDALLAFLDPSGKRSAFSRENGTNKLSLTLLDPASSTAPGAPDPQLLELARQVSAGYELNVSFSADGNASLTLADGTGATLVPVPAAKVISPGKKVSLAIGTGELLSLEHGLTVQFTW